MNKKKIFVLLIVLATFLSLTSSALLDGDDAKLQLGSELTYYLEIYYDGVDIHGVQSTDSLEAEIASGYIYVEDKLPDGLTFLDFVVADDGSVGAVNRTTGDACVGYVVGDKDGLNYDEDTRMVSFVVKNLKAGCSLTVGIKTQVPSTVDDPLTSFVELRRDFFNTATATEGPQTAMSNTVHAWIGKGSVLLNNKVTYKYTGTVPTSASPLPADTYYATGNMVEVQKDAIAEGYTFSGWKVSSGGVSISNNKFAMPNNDVVLEGSFTEISDEYKYDVSYEIEGEGPSDYEVPSTESYYEGTSVIRDTLKKGTVYNGYRFLGWETDSNIELSDENDFLMPAYDVKFVGTWELVTYSVSYEFMGNTLPANADSLLPETKSYRPGAIVKLETITSPDGWKFLGWYQPDNFEMPEEDIVIYGEWQKESGVFSPTITKEVIDEKEYYQPGDVVQYEIIVTNTADFAIYDVYVAENNEKAEFVENSSYVVEDAQIAFVETIAANSSVKLYAQYVVDTTDSGVIINEAEILGAIANNDYVFDTSKTYKDTADFNLMGKLKVCKYISMSQEHSKFQFNITNSDTGFESWLMLDANQCMNTYLLPGTYSVKEI